MNISDTEHPCCNERLLVSEATHERFSPPRLGIIHLLAWIGVSAVLMKVVQWGGAIDSMSGGFQIGMKVFFLANAYFYLAMIAAGIVGTSVILHAWYRGNRGRLQAGHWLVFNVTLGATLTTTTAIVFTIINTWTIANGMSANSPFNFKILLVSQAVTLLLTAALWLLAAIRTREDYPWKALLGFLAFRAGGTAMLSLYTVLVNAFPFPTGFIYRLPIGVAIVLLLLTIAVSTDISHGRKRDWLQWLGIAMLFIISISRVAQMVVSQYLMNDILSG